MEVLVVHAQTFRFYGFDDLFTELGAPPHSRTLQPHDSVRHP